MAKKVCIFCSMHTIPPVAKDLPEALDHGGANMIGAVLALNITSDNIDQHVCDEHGSMVLRSVGIWKSVAELFKRIVEGKGETATDSKPS